MAIGKGKTPDMKDFYHLIDAVINWGRNRVKKGGRLSKIGQRIGREMRR